MTKKKVIKGTTNRGAKVAITRNTGELSAAQKARLARMGQRTERKAIKAEVQKNRNVEYYKSKRTASRSAAVASAITTSEATRQQSAQVESREKTKRLGSITIDQYAKLINGNQNAENAVNPDDTKSDPSTSWTPNDAL